MDILRIYLIIIGDMAERYHDIEMAFSKEINEKALPYGKTTEISPVKAQEAMA